MSRRPRSERVRRFLSELGRRRVIRVAVAYCVGGVAVTEGANNFFPALGLEDWTTRLVAILVIVGLPVALVLAWAFDVVPDPGPVRGLAGRAAPDPARWAAVKDLFGRVMEAPPEAREPLLAEAAAQDEMLAVQVRSLLRAHEGAGPLDGLRDRVIGSLAGSSPPMADLTGATVLHYEVGERLQGGGMGVVYRGVDTRLGRPVALKFLSPHLIADPQAKERFIVEARAAATMDHPNLCTIHEVGEADAGQLFIAMTFYEGESLKERIARGQLGIDEALEVAVQVARGLACAAEHGIVHRDIKPANLMLTPDGTVKIVDFGLAKLAGEERTVTGALLGTVSYMSPEQTRGEHVDQRADVWSVGVVLYEMLAGRRPFRGGTDQAVIHAILNESPEPIEVAVPGLPPGVTAVVERATRKDPDDRYADAASLLKDLERLLADPSTRERAPDSPAVSPDGERRLITALSCAIGGFETMLDRVDPEALDQQMAALRSLIRGVVEDYGGVLNDFTEEGAVALFGAPVTHEDDGLRAVRAGLEILDAGGEEASDPGLELSAAVSAAHVGIQATDSGERRYRLGGALTKEVALLAASAETGALLVTPQLARSIAPFLDIEEREPVSLSSSQPPVTPLAVLGESETSSRLEALSNGELSRFVGRENEMALLMEALGHVRGGRGRAVSIVGDAGVGKSRLLYEFRYLLAEEGVRYVQGQGRSYGGLTPFVPLIDCLRGVLGLGRVTPEQAHDLVVQRTQALGPELEVYLPILLHMMSIETESYPLPDYLTEEELRSASAEALLSVFTLAAHGQPLVILLEDWHWADGGSIDVLEQLVEMVSAHSLLVVITSRPEPEVPEIPAHADAVRVDLGPLNDSESTELMRSALRVSRVPHTLADHLWERAGGNPFFIEELCHALTEQGVLVVENGGARFDGSLDGLAIPDTVQAVLRTRLDRLDPEAREVLRCASVIGRQFGLSLLREVVPSPARLDRALDGLRATGLVHRTGLVPEPTYRFKHALTLDVTYDGLLERQRRERHGMVGRAIEALHADHLEEYFDRLSDHFAGAQEWETAVRYGLAAAERAADLWRYGEAVATLDRTRTWIERSGGEDRTSVLVSLLFQQERHLERLGDRERQQQVIDELLSLVPVEPSPQRASVLARQGELSTLTGRYEEAREALEAAISLAEECGAVEVTALALRGVGHLCWRVGQYAEAVDPLRRLIAYDREHASATVLNRDLLNLGRIHRELGEWDEAWGLLEEAESLASEVHLSEQGHVANYKGLLLRAMGKLDEGLAMFEEADRIMDDAGLAAMVPVRISIHMVASAAVHLEAGQLDKGMSLYERAVELARRANRPDNLASALSHHGDALMAIGRPAEAAARFEEAAEIRERIGDDRILVMTRVRLARAYEGAADVRAAEAWASVRDVCGASTDRATCLLAYEREARLRDPEAKAKLLEQALGLAQEMEDAAAMARIHNGLGIMAWRTDALEEADRHLAQAAQCLEHAEDPSDLGVVLNAWGAVQASSGRHDLAHDTLERALAVNRQRGDLAREADSWSALGASHRAAGRWREAIDCYQRCAERRRAADDASGAGWALLRLAEVAAEGDQEESVETSVAQALEIALAMQDQSLERECLQLSAGEGRS